MRSHITAILILGLIETGCTTSGGGAGAPSLEALLVAGAVLEHCPQYRSRERLGRVYRPLGPALERERPGELDGLGVRGTAERTDALMRQAAARGGTLAGGCDGPRAIAALRGVGITL